MTTVDRYHSVQLALPSDVPTTRSRTRPLSTTITKRNIPPAVPSPPRQTHRNSPPRKPDNKLDVSDSSKMVSAESTQWLFTDAELAATPSVGDGLAIAEEKTRRAKAVNFINQSGILLKLPQLTLATASVFFHRFYMRYSMVPEAGGLHHYNIAATALFLATKSEENCRKTKEIVIAVAKVAQKNASLVIDEQSKEYWRWRDNILLYEELMLELLTFDVVLHSPYSALYKYLQKLKVDTHKELRNVAWAFLNDSCLTMLCLMMPPKDIAAGAMYFAARFTETQISDDENDAPWWEQVGAQTDNIMKAVDIMNDFYTENPLKRTDNPYENSPAAGTEEDLDETRQRRYSNAPTSNEDGARSQHSQNGHFPQDGTPVMNGNGTTEHVSQITDTSRPLSPPSEAPDPDPVDSTSQPIEPSGSSDAALKVAANDPATHEQIEYTNGDSLLTSQPSPPDSTKRKMDETPEEPATKRLKNDSGGESAPMIMSADASEDGELEE